MALQALSRYGIGDVVVEEPQPAEAFDNFQVWCDGKEMDVTAGFQLYARILEEYERSGSGDRPGWIVEMDRFYKIETAGGDPITQWLHQPMHYFEPPINVVRRHWAGIVEQLRDAPPTCGCSSAGTRLLRAPRPPSGTTPASRTTSRTSASAPPDLEHAIVTYRGRGVEIEIPTTVTPSWHR